MGVDKMPPEPLFGPSRQSHDLELLPSMCFGAPFSLQPDGKQVYITPTGKLVCPHGELSSTICYWLAAEKKARLEGLPLPPRGGSRGRSSCDCQSTDGLNVTPDALAALPSAPASLFEFLEDTGAELIKVKGRDARLIPHVPGPTFVTALGKLCCRHGASRASLSKKQKALAPSSRRPACQCVLKPLPARSGLKNLQLGKCTPCKAVLLQRPTPSWKMMKAAGGPGAFDGRHGPVLAEPFMPRRASVVL